VNRFSADRQALEEEEQRAGERKYCQYSTVHLWRVSLMSAQDHRLYLDMQEVNKHEWIPLDVRL